MSFVKESEKEIKYLIPETDYNRLMHLVKSSEKTLQTNFYFDFHDYRLALSGTTVRIREKDNSYELTVKNHMQELNNGFFSTEQNTKISKRKFNQYVSNGIQYTSLSLPQGKDYENVVLARIGSIVTLRSRLYLSNNNVLFIDKNQYLSIVDYEIEFEYIDDSQISVLDEYINNKNIKISPSDSKLKRLINRMVSCK